MYSWAQIQELGIETCITTCQDKRNSLAGWYFTLDEMRSGLAAERILNPSIDLSNCCNLNCPYCFVEKNDSPRKLANGNEFTRSEVLSLIGDLSTMGAKTINIVGSGEPTIDENFREVVDFIFSLGLKTVLFTNGIRLANDLDIIDFLHCKNVTVVLKYNSKDPTVQDLVVGRLGYTWYRDKALENLMNFGFQSYLPTRLGLDIMLFEGNVSEIPSIYRMCRNEGIFPLVGDYIPTGRTARGKFLGFAAIEGLSSDQKSLISDILLPVSEITKRELYNKLTQIDDEFGIKHLPNCAYLNGNICTQILGLYVDIHGNIWPCVAKSRISSGSLITEPLGNIRGGTKLLEIWGNHQDMHHLRSNYNGSCPYKKHFL